ncbi:mechanosensitive ion channel family protein [Roseateles amylovorans]|uniref:Mechanosensitive ion channel n=1 Tax=Roseateles amylovorans TaxID=2978473 RepID=A0ABY6B2H2_9BURK|nr:mechanosensitive ion channel domain-containing protein [Roseateles amylovorans]UXH79113.1 mechanosensitive ion channel [Roseateles amylovorans]
MSFVTLLLIGLWLPAGIAVAASTSTSASTAHGVPLAASSSVATSTAASAVPVPLADILSRADRDQWVIDRIRRQLTRSDVSDGLTEGLAVLSKSVEDKRRTYTPDEIRQLPVIRLESLDRYWALDERRFQQWQAEAVRHLAPLAEDATVLNRIRLQWEATLAAQTQLPAALADRIAALLADLAEAEQGVSPRLARQIALGQEARELAGRIQTGRDAVGEVIGVADQRLFQRDLPPLWASAAVPRASAASAASATEVSESGLDLESSFAADYLAVSTLKIQATTVLQVSLLILMLWAARRSRRDAALTASAPSAMPPVDGATGHVPSSSLRPGRLLSRPLSAWVLLGMLVTLPLRTDAPLMTRELAVVIALVPALRLFPVSSLKDWSPMPQIVVMLYALKWLCLLALDNALLYRVLLLGLSILALAWLVYWLCTVHAGPLLGVGPLSPAWRALGWSAVAMLGAGALAQISGHVTLGQTLINGVFDLAYLGLLLHLAQSLLLALLQLVMGPAAASASRSPLWRTHAGQVGKLLGRGLQFAAKVGWLIYAASVLRLLRPVQSAVEAVLGHRFEVGEISISLGDLLVFALSVLLAYVSARLVRGLLRNRLNDNPALPRGAGNSIASLSYYAVLMLGFMVALSAAGFKVSQLALVFGALGVGIGFGLQGIVSNFVSGLVLMFERPIQPGDMIEIGDILGRVRHIGLRATVLRTADGADVVVPNGALLAGNLKNWTMFDRHRRIEVPISVSFGSDVAQVLTTLDAVARTTAGVAEDPPPAALFIGTGTSSLDFSLRVWTCDFDQWMTVRSGLLARVLEAFGEAGITIPFSQLDVNLRQVVEPAAASTLGPAEGPSAGPTEAPPMPPASPAVS